MLWKMQGDGAEKAVCPVFDHSEFRRRYREGLLQVLYQRGRLNEEEYERCLSLIAEGAGNACIKR